MSSLRLNSVITLRERVFPSRDYGIRCLLEYFTIASKALYVFHEFFFLQVGKKNEGNKSSM